MNALMKRLLSCYLNRCSNIKKEELFIKLYPYVSMHNIAFSTDGIYFHDIETGIIMQMDDYEPVDYIPFAAIATVGEIHNGNCLRILLRSGEFHILDKHSLQRSRRNIYTEPRKPYPGEIRMWAWWRKLKRG